MPCYHPLQAYRKAYYGGITFDKKLGTVPLKLPCGQCIGCRLERSRQWAMRCMHESSLHNDNCFITLTYDNEHLPADGSLKKEHYQKFMKRLRKHFKNQKIRYYHCGEYGEKHFRPHYHAILFGIDFYDKQYFNGQGENSLYISPTLNKLWRFGFSTIGSVTFESAAYVARYIMKKVNGKNAKEHYERVNIDTGEVYHLTAEYNTMSRRPGIASDWYDKYKDDVFPSDFITMNGKKLKPPKFYDRIYEIEDPDAYEKLKRKRMLDIQKVMSDNTQERLKTKEIVKKAQLNKLVRSLDDEQNLNITQLKK